MFYRLECLLIYWSYACKAVEIRFSLLGVRASHLLLALMTLTPGMVGIAQSSFFQLTYVESTTSTQKNH